MQRRKIESIVGSWVEEITHQSELEFVDVEYVKEGSSFVLRVFLDKPGGIDVEDCRWVSLALSDRLDQEDPIDHAYSLEVSSPGIERPLKREEDYTSFAGRTVHIKTFSPIEGRKEFEGTLEGLADGMVGLSVGRETVAIPLEQIAKARLVVEF